MVEKAGKPRNINWNATFEVDGPTKSRGPAGGIRFSTTVDALVTHGRRERQLRIEAHDKSKRKASEKVVDRTLDSLLGFIQEGLKKPLNKQEIELVEDQFVELFRMDATPKIPGNPS